MSQLSNFSPDHPNATSLPSGEKAGQSTSPASLVSDTTLGGGPTTAVGRRSCQSAAVTTATRPNASAATTRPARLRTDVLPARGCVTLTGASGPTAGKARESGSIGAPER